MVFSTAICILLFGISKIIIMGNSQKKSALYPRKNSEMHKIWLLGLWVFLMILILFWKKKRDFPDAEKGGLRETTVKL